ncbi:hypothetical protein D1AOALGA4SA_159 [Olavius algarvensis Delta 1 endosymbiont]|nr:hypothetical protein D1AOALGA4SA_159 [Olavius algarvensis Delta 1 endosymbiont]
MGRHGHHRIHSSRRAFFSVKLKSLKYEITYQYDKKQGANEI